MSDAPPIITLLTDFGLQDAYVGVMKGVILSRCPRAALIDLTHGVPPGNIRAAGHLLAGAWAYFPPHTVHVAVVDPGVGSGRRVLAARVGGQHFIAPDNGLLSAVFDARPPRQVVRVENQALFVQPTSNTFHGRDIFAPAAAALARGAPLSELGPESDTWVDLPPDRPAREPDGSLSGRVVYIDRFGNLVTNLPAGDLPADPEIEIAGRRIRGLLPSYAAAAPGRLLAVIGSTGCLEISVNRGDAAATLDASVGQPVRVFSSGQEPSS